MKVIEKEMQEKIVTEEKEKKDVVKNEYLQARTSSNS